MPRAGRDRHRRARHRRRRRHATSSTSTCRTCPRPTSTASAARRAPARRASRSRSATSEERAYLRDIEKLTRTEGAGGAAAGGPGRRCRGRTAEPRASRPGVRRRRIARGHQGHGQRRATPSRMRIAAPSQSARGKPQGNRQRPQPASSHGRAPKGKATARQGSGRRPSGSRRRAASGRRHEQRRSPPRRRPRPPRPDKATAARSAGSRTAPRAAVTPSLILGRRAATTRGPMRHRECPVPEAGRHPSPSALPCGDAPSPMPAGARRSRAFEARTLSTLPEAGCVLRGSPSARILRRNRVASQARSGDVASDTGRPRRAVRRP